MPPATQKSKAGKATSKAHTRRAEARRAVRVRRFWLVLPCCVVLLLLLLFYRPPSFVGSAGDTALTLFTARVILQEGTIRLDARQSELARHGHGPAFGSWGMVTKNGHLYSYFPLGSVVLSIPLVAVYNALDIEVLGRAGVPAHSFAAALTCAGLFLAMYFFARRYLRQPAALLVALAFLLGSSLSSVLGIALWTHNFLALLVMAILHLVVEALESRRPPRSGSLIGALLFFAYLCRPTAALLAPVVFFALYTVDKRSAFQAAAVAAVAGLAFVGFSYYEFGQLLPDYYLPARLGGDSDYWTALYGHLLSPSRGLFIYTPVLLVMALTPGILRKALAGRKVLLLFALWPVLHLLAISGFPHWWGGWSYGPRLMVDTLPAVYLFFILYLKQLWGTPHSLIRSVRIASLGVAAAASISIHTIQGLHSPTMWQWNAFPNVDKNTELLFDWKYPQFLHTRARHVRRMTEYRELLDPRYLEWLDRQYPELRDSVAR